MSPRRPVNILIVDDQPGKLMSLEAILADMGETIIKAQSADEALRHLLETEIAVVLVDVCMPRMDGFALAELIRGHPRFRRTAILFISAVALGDADRLKAYDLGAVDYIPVPVVPEVLRAKVAVFVELYRKTLQLEELNRELEQRVAERTGDLEASNARLRESEAKFRTLAENMSQLAWMTDGRGNALWFNQRWFEYTGTTLDEMTGWQWQKCHHPEHEERALREVTAFFRAGEAWEDTFPIRAKDGTYRWFLTRAVPIKDEAGTVVQWFGTNTDITEQREAQQVLARDRETLEQIVAERTAELERSNERLRLADRMATIGTLSAGLGHDMGNLLLPVRMRLDAIEKSSPPGAVGEDIAAIRKATEYLQRLAGSLRLLALDPNTESVEQASTGVVEWWAETEGMIRNGVQRPTVLSAEIPPGLPPVRIGRAALTQVVFNLVQNAGDALSGRSDGRVVVRAAPSPTGQAVELCVSDNGPGMSAEAKRRCMEPFFTTKPRGLSTGLGLALVSGIIKRVRGSIDIVTEPEKGTTIKVVIPVAERVGAFSTGGVRGTVAVVTLTDNRLLAHVESVLSALSFKIRRAERPGEADVWVVQGGDGAVLDAARAFAESGTARRAVVFGSCGGANGHDGRVLCLEQGLKPSVMRARIYSALAGGPVPQGERA